MLQQFRLSILFGEGTNSPLTRKAHLARLDSHDNNLRSGGKILVNVPRRVHDASWSAGGIDVIVLAHAIDVVRWG
jgi:hypothetical protein